jgi:hypothetical protein
MANRVLEFLLLGLLSSALVQAQEPKVLPRHPGDVIKYEIKFDGPNADRIKTVYARMNTGQNPPKDQAGFSNQFSTLGQVQASSPRTFAVEMKIPDNVATGEYRLYISATAAEGGADYADGQEFDVPAVHVENPRTFTPPSIKVAPLP